MSNLGWTIEEDKFEQDTIIGNVEFTNIIATLDPNAPRRMVIACMYISCLFTKPFCIVYTFHNNLFCLQVIMIQKFHQRDF